MVAGVFDIFKLGIGPSNAMGATKAIDAARLDLAVNRAEC
jgi:hypothetical protein